MEQIEKMITGYPTQVSGSLINGERGFCRQGGYLMALGPKTKKTTHVHVFLFTDLIVWTAKQKLKDTYMYRGSVPLSVALVKPSAGACWHSVVWS